MTGIDFETNILTRVHVLPVTKVQHKFERNQEQNLKRTGF